MSRLGQQLLSHLELSSVGPARKLAFAPAARLSLVAGDNGLGKSFLLECAWWVLTGQWAGLPAYPREDAKKGGPKIIFQIADASGAGEKVSASYDWENPSADKWRPPNKRPTLPGLLVYVRVDGSFAVYDPARLPAQQNGKAAPRAFVFNKDEIRDGYEEEINGRRRPRINGLLRDWVSWQNSPEKHPFETFKKVLARLSPPEVGDLGALLPGEPTRIPDDSREIPTLAHPYGIVPFIYTSAGVQRIVSLAYLLVWAWHEHKINSSVSRRDPEHRMVILVDEIEAHLHPQWQRSILPALLEVSQDLAADLQVQLIVATHSPLVMASVEPYFDHDTDKLFLLDVDHELLGSEVSIKEIDFLKEGLVSSWLTSDVFGLEQARSLEGEKAVEDARKLQQSESPSPEEIKEVSTRLAKYLPEIEGFWPRWIIFAEKHGVEL